MPHSISFIKLSFFLVFSHSINNLLFVLCACILVFHLPTSFLYIFMYIFHFSFLFSPSFFSSSFLHIRFSLYFHVNNLDLFNYYVLGKGTEPVVSKITKYGNLQSNRAKISIDCFVASLHSPFFTGKKPPLTPKWEAMGKKVVLSYRLKQDVEEAEVKKGKWQKASIAPELVGKTVVKRNNKIFLPWLEQLSTEESGNDDDDDEDDDNVGFFPF